MWGSRKKTRYSCGRMFVENLVGYREAYFEAIKRQRKSYLYYVGVMIAGVHVA